MKALMKHNVVDTTEFYAVIRLLIYMLLSFIFSFN